MVVAFMSPFVSRSVGLSVKEMSKKCQKLSKKRFRDWKWLHKWASILRLHTRVYNCTHENKTISFVQGSCNKEAHNINQIHSLVSYAPILHGLLTTHTRSFLWPEPHLFLVSLSWFLRFLILSLTIFLSRFLFEQKRHIHVVFVVLYIT